jgi:hypothetical protein
MNSLAKRERMNAADWAVHIANINRLQRTGIRLQTFNKLIIVKPDDWTAVSPTYPL